MLLAALISSNTLTGKQLHESSNPLLSLLSKRSPTDLTGKEHGKLPSQGQLSGNAVLQAIMQSQKSKNLMRSSIPFLASEHPKMLSSSAVLPEQKDNQLSHLRTEQNSATGDRLKKSVCKHCFSSRGTSISPAMLPTTVSSFPSWKTLTASPEKSLFLSLALFRLSSFLYQLRTNFWNSQVEPLLPICWKSTVLRQ